MVRAPVWLYWMRLGFLLGNRMLMLVHRGRSSGLRRYAVLEVVDRPPPTSTSSCGSGFGEAAQWYRNLLADPHVRISVGWRRDADAVAKLLAV